jgi:hypothetical protein
MHARSQSNAQAIFNLGYMHEHGHGLPLDLHLAKRYYDQAVEVDSAAKLPVMLALTSLWLRKNYADSFLVRHYFLYVICTSYMLLLLSHGMMGYLILCFTASLEACIIINSLCQNSFLYQFSNELLLLIPCSYRPVPSNLYQMYSMNFSIQSMKWYVGKAF